ncbi:2-C-methyl-D-erythritol 4-phosphate cytidylyltransferase [Corynebacterium sp. p3-SID1056]|uniref:2-C-methyl-D-erythritol 4-phosphate cytidylyltransferase n=1 Tax=Corynebacterium sp. p3-SID1056 TaxID=2916092 RepID=UPI0021A7D98D|nr:2-C-methyl-D-erythritol 4-phosphate cytidylyltransferase [Corynebacterium sp. p3-SID1056]MCT2339653.1 2-C-methyl-D-erythritol 4-phosphate cytidylyltransferase [Corynebacterium sp. p3-SID1056]
MSRRVVAVVAAAGQGTRLGADVPKAYVPLRGRSLLERSVTAMETAEIVDAIYVVVSPAMEPVARRALQGHEVAFVHGGAERADSIFAALKAIPLADACVLVHDAARALTPPGMIARVARAVLDGAPAVVPVLPVADTVKEVSADGAVVATPDRSRLRAVQTPQGFDLRELRSANEAYFAGEQDFVATDDASLMEWYGAKVATVQGDPMAFKITTPIDLRLATSITNEAEPTIFEVPGN